MGNCGVGFAPVRAEDLDLLIELMEGVEDIPGVACMKGFPGTRALKITWTIYPRANLIWILARNSLPR